MLESNENDANIAGQHHDSDIGDISANDCGRYASAACEAYEDNDRVLAMHLYLTAYEEGCKHAPLPDMQAVSALRKAWDLACELRERSIAEYIYDKLEPYLSSEETKSAARNLQDMALDKLSEIGIARSDLEDIADMISEEIGATARISSVTPLVSSAPMQTPPPSSDEKTAACDMSAESASDVAADERVSAEHQSASDASASDASPDAEGSAHKAKPSVSARSKVTASPLRFSDLVGFDAVIEDLRALGIGIQNDAEYRLLVDTLRAQHGLEGLSAAGSIVFRTSSREDASLLMAATAGELGLPTVRVQMQPGPQGMPVLCVSTMANNPARMGGAAGNKLAFESPGVLVLEDIDMWGAPLAEAAAATDGEGIMFASMSRAAREAFALIGSAVGNPDVYVLASVAGDAFDQGYLYDMMEPMSIVDIYLPDELERRTIWNAIAFDHPSVRQLDLSRLTRVSRNLSRFDIVAAGREAVEDAYKRGLKARRYVPVTQDMMFEHIANFQPLESDEYRFLEEAVATEFRKHIDELERLGDSDIDASSGEKGGF